MLFYVNMVVPKVVFTYSSVYDERIGRRKDGKGKLIKGYPSHKEIVNYIRKIEGLWKILEKPILLELCKVTKLMWSERYIKCYVVGRVVPFSEPMTIPIYEKYPDLFIDVLVHELIHRLFIQKGNYERLKKCWFYFKRKYKNENYRAIIHIPLYAIHSYIYDRFFDETRLKRDVGRSEKSIPHKRAWRIVQKEGYENTIGEFRRRIENLRFKNKHN